jgi:hypothetical protein
MRRVLTFPLIVVAWFAAQTAAARADACTPDPKGVPVCGTGKDAMRAFADTISPSKQYAFAWRSPDGLPAGDDIPAGVENILVRLSDGVVVAKLGGEYWAIGEMRANRYDLVAAWSSDSKAVIEVASSRWDSDSFAYYRLDGAEVTKLDLRTLVEPAVKGKLPKAKRGSHAFRIREEPPVTLDARGHVRFAAMVYVPKGEDSLDYAIQVDITAKHGKPAARIVSMRRIKSD